MNKDNTNFLVKMNMRTQLNDIVDITFRNVNCHTKEVSFRLYTFRFSQFTNIFNNYVIRLLYKNQGPLLALNLTENRNEDRPVIMKAMCA